MSAQAQGQKTSLTTIIHIIIGLFVMGLCPYILQSPSFSFPTSPKLEGLGFEAIDGFVSIAMSPAGFTAVMVFLGVLWLWIFVDTFWPSVLAVALVALSPYYPFPVVMGSFLGNPTTVLTFFLFFFVAALVKSQVVNYISNYFLTRDALQGRPWLLMITLLSVAYIGSWFDVFSTLFMMWPVTYLILNETGYKPGDRMSTFMVGNFVGILLLASTSNIITGPMLYVSSAYNGFIARVPDLGLSSIDPIKWIVFFSIISVCTMALVLFAMRFIFRLDVEAIKNFDTSKFKQNPLPPMNWKQKTTLILFGLFILWMFLPALLPANLPITMYLKSKTFIGSMLVFIALVSIKRNGEPLAKINELAAGVPWGMFFLLASAFYFGGVLTDPKTNIPILLELAFTNSLQGLSYMPFLLTVMALALVMSNLMNSIVSGIIVAPIIATVATSYGFEVLPIIILFCTVLFSAILTPAAGVPGAVLYGNKEWLPGKEGIFYAVFFATTMTIVILVVGIPLARIMF